jgi:hypothetical protein
LQNLFFKKFIYCRLKSWYILLFFGFVFYYYFFIQNETKRIIIEFGSRRQQCILTDRHISTSKLLYLIGNRFGIKFDNNSPYILQMYDNELNEYKSLENNKQIFDLGKDIEQLHRFRIVSKSVQSQVEEFIFL